MAKKYTNLSKVLKKLLFQKDMKSVDLAKEVNLPQPTIHRLLVGKSTRPYKSSLEPIADYFDISVDQLLGEQPLPGEETEFETKQTIAKAKAKSIPLLSWKSLANLEEAIGAGEEKEELIVTGNVSDKAFALLMPDSSMEPLFSRGSILIFDPEVKTRDRSYVLAEIQESNSFTFRQLLLDLEDKYLKPLNPELNRFQLRMLSENDKIIACLIESRHNFKYEQDEYLIEET